MRFAPVEPVAVRRGVGRAPLHFEGSARVAAQGQFGDLAGLRGRLWRRNRRRVDARSSRRCPGHARGCRARAVAVEAQRRHGIDVRIARFGRGVAVAGRRVAAVLRQHGQRIRVRAAPDAIAGDRAVPGRSPAQGDGGLALAGGLSGGQRRGRGRRVGAHALGDLVRPGAAAVLCGLLVVVAGPHHHLVVDSRRQTAQRQGRGVGGGVGVTPSGSVVSCVREVVLIGRRPGHPVVGRIPGRLVPRHDQLPHGVARQGQAGHLVGGGFRRGCWWAGHRDGGLVAPGAAPGIVLVLAFVVARPHLHLVAGAGGQVVHRQGHDLGVRATAFRGVGFRVGEVILAGRRPAYPVVRGRLAGCAPCDNQLPRVGTRYAQVADGALLVLGLHRMLAVQRQCAGQKASYHHDKYDRQYGQWPDN